MKATVNTKAFQQAVQQAVKGLAIPKGMKSTFSLQIVANADGTVSIVTPPGFDRDVITFHARAVIEPGITFANVETLRRFATQFTGTKVLLVSDDMKYSGLIPSYKTVIASTFGTYRMGGLPAAWPLYAQRVQSALA